MVLPSVITWVCLCNELLPNALACKQWKEEIFGLFFIFYFYRFNRLRVIWQENLKIRLGCTKLTFALFLHPFSNKINELHWRQEFDTLN